MKEAFSFFHIEQGTLGDEEFSLSLYKTVPGDTDRC